MTIKVGEVPKAIIPPSPFVKTESPSSSASLMTLGGELFEQFFRSIVEQLEGNAGLSAEQNAEIANYFETDDREIMVKRDRLAEFVARLGSEGEAIRNEEKRLAARRAGFEKIRDCLMSSIHQQMLDVGVKKAEGKLFSFSIRKNPPSVQVDDEKLIPAEFFDYVPRVKKQEIKDALEAGQEVPGARLISDRTSLVIR